MPSRCVRFLLLFAATRVRVAVQGRAALPACSAVLEALRWRPSVQRGSPLLQVLKGLGSGLFGLAGLAGFFTLDGLHHRGRRSVGDRKSTRLNSSHLVISYAVFCLKKKKRRTPRCRREGPPRQYSCLRLRRRSALRRR